MREAFNETETFEENQAKKNELNVWQTKACSWLVGNVPFVG